MSTPTSFVDPDAGRANAKDDSESILVLFVREGGWQEAWFLALCAFHVWCALTVLTAPERIAGAVRASMFCLLSAVGLLVEHLNEMAALHWR